MKRLPLRACCVLIIICLVILVASICLYLQIHKTNGLVGNVYTWENIWTKQEGTTIFAGIPRNATMENMKEYYGLSYPEYELAIKNGGSDLCFRLENANVYCYLVFEDPDNEDSLIKRISLRIDKNSSGLTSDDYLVFVDKMEESLHAHFNGTRGKWEGGDIEIIIPFYSHIKNESMSIEIIYR